MIRPERRYALAPLSTGKPASIAEIEAALADWFEAQVIVTSSGRSALSLCFRALGLSRYRSRIALSPMISGCVLEAVIRHAFPVDVTRSTEGPAADLTLHYHQYGLPQIGRPSGQNVEDICHSFFASAETGKRNWSGPAAVFSLPKSARLTAMMGGILTEDAQFAAELRALRDASPCRDEMVARAERAVFRDAYGVGGAALEALYLSRLLHPRCHEDDGAGVPTSLSAWQSIGRARQESTMALLDATPPEWLPEGWHELIAQKLPFALPLFAPESVRDPFIDCLRSAGFEAGAYQIDTARSFTAPHYKVAVLIPCHHELDRMAIEDMRRCIEEATSCV